MVMKRTKRTQKIYSYFAIFDPAEEGGIMFRFPISPDV